MKHALHELNRTRHHLEWVVKNREFIELKPHVVKIYKARIESYNEAIKFLNGFVREKDEICPDCRDYGWIYDEDGTRSTCPCHY